MRAFLGGQHALARTLPDAAEQRDEPDVTAARIEQLLGADGAMANKRMFFSLVMTVKGSAQMVIRGAEAQHGAACWRALLKRYEPATAVRAQSIMQTLLTVTTFPHTLAEFEEKHGTWERDNVRYEMASGEVFNFGVKKSIFPQKAPKNIRTVLRMQE